MLCMQPSNISQQIGMGREVDPDGHG